MAIDAQTASQWRSLLCQAHAAGNLPADLRARIGEALRQPFPAASRRQPLPSDHEDPYFAEKLEKPR